MSKEYSKIESRPKIFYCADCEHFFRINVSSNKIYLSYGKKCPYCQRTNVISLDYVLSGVRHDFHEFVQRIEKVREVVDKIVLRLDQLVNVVSKEVAIAYFHKCGILAELMNVFADIGLLIEHLEDDLAAFNKDLQRLLKDIVDPTTRVLKLSLIKELVSEYDGRVHEYARKVKDIADKMVLVKQKIQNKLQAIRIILNLNRESEINIMDIISVNKEFIVVSNTFIYHVDPFKRCLKRKLSLGELVLVNVCKKLMSSGICLESMNGKKYFIKMEIEAAEKLAASISEIMRRQIYEKEDDTSLINFKSKYKVLKPNTRSIRDHIFSIKTQIINTLTKIRNDILNSLKDNSHSTDFQGNGKRDRGKEFVINELLRDLESKYRQGLISLEEYMRFKHVLLNKLHEAEGDKVVLQSDDESWRLRDNSF